MAGDRQLITLKSFSAAQPSGRTGNGSTFIKADMLKLDGNGKREGEEATVDGRVLIWWETFLQGWDAKRSRLNLFPVPGIFQPHLHTPYSRTNHSVDMGTTYGDL